MTREDEIKKVLESFQIDRLLKLLRIEAIKQADGHYTVFSFTSCYSVGFGTPSCREDVALLPKFKTAKEAIINALVERSSCYSTQEERDQYWRGIKELAESRYVETDSE